MHAIVRPGPYICAEWSNGGLPYWLFADGTVGVRRNEPGFLAAVRDYLEQLAPVLVPRQVDQGGPIVLVQVENEYGAYGSDASYLRALEQMHRDIGLTVPFTSVDQPMGTMLEDGSLPSLHKTGSFGSRSTERLERLRQAQPTGPLMCSEFWDGCVRQLGRAPPHHARLGLGVGPRRLLAAARLGEHLHVPRRHELRLHERRERQGRVPADRDVVRDYDAPLDEAGRPTRSSMPSGRSSSATRPSRRSGRRCSWVAGCDGRVGCVGCAGTVGCADTSSASAASVRRPRRALRPPRTSRSGLERVASLRSCCPRSPSGRRTTSRRPRRPRRSERLRAYGPRSTCRPAAS